MQTNSAPDCAMAVFTGKIRKTARKYGGLREGEIGANFATFDAAVGDNARARAHTRGTRAQRTGTRQRANARTRTHANASAHGHARPHAHARAHARTHATPARGPPPTPSMRKQSGRHSQTRSKCDAFASSLERENAREGSDASEALTARGRQCFERMNGGIIGGLGLVCQVKCFVVCRKCR